jgi:hypothetical protein
MEKAEIKQKDGYIKESEAGAQIGDYFKVFEEEPETLPDSLDALRDKFENASSRYPGLTYVWTEFTCVTISWQLPGEIEEDEVYVVYDSRNNDTCFEWYGIWNWDKREVKRPGPAVQFWVMKPRSELWDSSNAGREFYGLAYAAGQLIGGKQVLGQTVIPMFRCIESIFQKTKDGRPICNIFVCDSAVVRWLFAIRELRRPTARREFGADGYMVAWQDVFHESSLLCNQLLSEQKRTSSGEAPKKPPELSETEKNIIEALNTDTLTGEKLAAKAGYPPNSNFKSTLAGLRKRGILGNRAPGYFVKPEYHFLLEKSDQSQD